MSVIIVISSTFPFTYGVFYMTVKCWVFGDRHAIVTLIVIEKKA
jgi:hypothetical protein